MQIQDKCPFFQLYDSLPNAAGMYLSLPEFTVAGFKALKAKVKQQLLTKENNIAKYRLEIGNKEKAMIAFLDEGVLVFIVSLYKNHCCVITTKSLLRRISDIDQEGIRLTHISAVLLLIHEVLSGKTDRRLLTLEADPIKNLIKQCTAIGDPIDNPFVRYNTAYF